MWIASRSPSGVADSDGLYLDDPAGPGLLAPLPQFSALARHPRLPVLYGLGAVEGDGRLHALFTDGTRVADLPSGGEEPCALAVSPDGGVLVVVNYGGTLARFTLDDAGLPTPAEVVALTGSGPDPDRQEGPHPHHACFVPAAGPGYHDLVVCDLGADAVIAYAWRDGLAERRRWPVPPGTGPRHLAHLGGRRVVVSGELSARVLVGSLDDGAWESCAASGREPGVRTYPSDVVAATDGRMAYVANRGADTVTSVLCTHAPEVLGEHDAGGAWPLSLAIHEGRLLVACRDSDAVTAMPLRGGIARDGGQHAAVPAPAWIED